MFFSILYTTVLGITVEIEGKARVHWTESEGDERTREHENEVRGQEGEGEHPHGESHLRVVDGHNLDFNQG